VVALQLLDEHTALPLTGQVVFILIHHVSCMSIAKYLIAFTISNGCAKKETSSKLEVDLAFLYSPSALNYKSQ
jgi:hypothetical protein